MDILSKAVEYMGECDHGLDVPQIADLIRCLDSLGIKDALLDCSVSFILMACEQARNKRGAQLHLVSSEVPTLLGGAEPLVERVGRDIVDVRLV